MAVEIARSASMPIALRRLHDISNGRLEIMTLMYDLDGALEAGQLGMARYTAVSLLDASVALWLRERNIALPDFEHPQARARVALRLLGAVNADLADRVSHLYTAQVPTEDRAVTAHCRTVLGTVGELTGYRAAGLNASVRGWADSAQAVRAMCERLGVPVSDFYWAPPEAESWYSDVLRFVSEDRRGD